MAEDAPGRTDEPEIAEAIRAGQMLVATADGRIVGCLRTRALDADHRGRRTHRRASRRVGRRHRPSARRRRRGPRALPRRHDDAARALRPANGHPPGQGAPARVVQPPRLHSRHAESRSRIPPPRRTPRQRPRRHPRLQESTLRGPRLGHVLGRTRAPSSAHEGERDGVWLRRRSWWTSTPAMSTSPSLDARRARWRRCPACTRPCTIAARHGSPPCRCELPGVVAELARARGLPAAVACICRWTPSICVERRCTGCGPVLHGRALRRRQRHSRGQCGLGRQLSTLGATSPADPVEARLCTSRAMAVGQPCHRGRHPGPRVAGHHAAAGLLRRGRRRRRRR